MAFDVEGARKAGYTDAEIASALAERSGFDLKGAKSAGYSDGEVIAKLSSGGEFAAGTKKTVADKVGGAARDVAAGALRGAGSIGATIMAPLDAAARAAGVQNDIIGRTDRREAMDAALADLTGADTGGIGYAAGKLGAELAGTAGVGGALAGTLAKIPGIATAAPGVIEAVKTAGMSAGSATGLPGMAARVAGGALTGGAAAGLVDPSDAAGGAAIGGAAPVVMKALGAAGGAVGRVIRGPQQTPEVAAAVQAARDAGYVIPPSQAKPSLANRVLEGVSGKISTAQNASAKNQQVTNALAAKAIGLPTDVQITQDVLQGVRKSAGQAYDAVASAGIIAPTKSYTDALDKIAEPALKAAAGFPNAAPSPVLGLVDSLRSSAFDAASAVAKIKELRSTADDAFRAGNTDVGRAAKSAAAALEGAIEEHLKSSKQLGLLDGFREARKLIAKTYSVESALNPATGNVDGKKLASLLRKGKPLSGELKRAAEFAGAFPKAAQMPETIGSRPQFSPLDLMGGGLLSGVVGSPLAMAAAAIRPVARAAALSPMVQGRLIQKPGMAAALADQLPTEELTQLFYRSLPVIAGSSGAR